MRTFITVLLFLAIPTFAAAQQQADPVELDVAPTVQLEQSSPTPASTAPAINAVSADAPDADVEAEARTTPMEDAADMQEPGSRNWWWIVGAVVVGGLIVVLLT